MQLPRSAATVGRLTQEYLLSEDSEGLRWLRAFFQPDAVRRRRTALGVGFVVVIVARELPIPIMATDGVDAASQAGGLVFAGFFCLDIAIEIGIRMRRWAQGRVIIVKLFPGDQERKD